MEMISESRIACDTRHRLQYENSHPRLIKLVGIGATGAGIARDLMKQDLHHVDVVILNSERGTPVPADMLEAISTRAGDLAQALSGADVIVMVASAGDDVSLAPVVRQIARRNKIMVSGVLIGDQVSSSEESPNGLNTLRASSDILAVVSDDSYVMDMLNALRA